MPNGCASNEKICDEYEGGNKQRSSICAQTVTKSVSTAVNAIILAASANVRLGLKARRVKMKKERSLVAIV